MQKRKIKDLLYEQVARVGKAVSSPKRLEMLEVLVQGEKMVDALARDVGIDIKLASSHLRVLKEARLVSSRREGRFIAYRLSGDDVAGLWVSLHMVAEEHLMELRAVLEKIVAAPERLTPETRAGLLDKARQGDVLVLDVRPEAEYRAGHLPYARSMPIQELEQKLAELPRDREVIAYCRGPFCLFAAEAVALLRKNGFRASKISDGIAEWSAAGMPLEGASTV
ncbi:MAG: ArsR family transcriptional regulator [Rhodocyclales bacterium RIFCSPLOWO2_02_FULL_63_24]|nr:MAG: ArsR family transcriptional regulator [Rhodocyclales bacterium RIFCSPLOWO2_02_FULL_63_24]